MPLKIGSGNPLWLPIFRIIGGANLVFYYFGIAQGLEKYQKSYRPLTHLPTKLDTKENFLPNNKRNLFWSAVFVLKCSIGEWIYYRFQNRFQIRSV
mgnify:CR=1 FL=1